ncbi:hypothetical protein KCU71_g368, partial [Aureobasidium melanogenum]
MDKLPPEIISEILGYCPRGRPSRGRPCLAPYALISKQWQQIVERLVFSSIRLKSSELGHFTDVYGDEAEEIHRRSALQQLKYTIEPTPGTDEALESEIATERAIARQEATEAVLFSLGELYSILSSWSTNKTITLEIGFPQETCISKAAIELIPRTELVKRFEFKSTAQRDPVLLASIASQMIGLQDIKWELDDYDKNINSVSRRKARYDFSKQVQSLVEICPSLRTIELRFVNETPSDENIVVPSILLPHVPVDHLSQSLKLLSSMTDLRTLVLHSVVLSEQFFQQSKLSWPSLSRLEINYSPMAADGDWFFEREPNTVGIEQYRNLVSRRLVLERIHKTQEDQAKITNFDQEYDPARQDDETEDLDDAEWGDVFRTWPSQRLEAMLISMVQVAGQMPALRIFTASADMPDCAPYQLFQFLYLVSGEIDAGCLRDFTGGSEHRHQRRLYWRVPSSWRMNEELGRAWSDLLGEDGVIEYHD